MWTDNQTHHQDLEAIGKDRNIPWTNLDGKTVFVTGATGLIGLNLVNALLYYGLKLDNPPKVVALVRNMERARALYAEQLKVCAHCLQFVVGDVTSLFAVDAPIDYIVHGASQTASAAFVTKPVETIDTAVTGTKRLLELAKYKNVKSMVYLSSMEVYGWPTEEHVLPESSPAWFDSMAVRSCYPESKRMCEALCAAYASEYGVPVKVVRLAQTFGPGVHKDDERVFADFARKALKDEDIVMRTRGDSSRMYLYTMDAVAAILTVLLKGENGGCYNAANKNTYCSIKDMAELVSAVLSGGRARVVVQASQEAQKKYFPLHKLKLDTAKLENLGWKATCDLAQMYKRMIKGF